MSKLKWDETGKRLYEAGVDHGVLYPMGNNQTYSSGVVWNGLTAVNENPSGAEPNALYADNMKYLNLMSAEEFGATIEAYTYPKEFEECDGSAEIAPGVVIGQQDRKSFGLCYRTKIGNDVEQQGHGYKLHLVYGCLAAPSSRNYETVNDNPDAIKFSWEITTTPVDVPGHKVTACITVDSTTVDEDKLASLEEILYGKDADGEEAAVEPRLPLPSEIVTLFGTV